MNRASGISSYKKVLRLIGGVLSILFLILFVLVMSGFDRDEPGKNRPRYVVVLGAKVRPDGLSPTLKRRLDVVLPLLQEDTLVSVIVSGGKGSDEPESEAQAMATYLIGKGVSADRIMLEDQSSNTYENLRFSRKKISGSDQALVPIWLATSNYHQYRAQQLAIQAGFKPYGIPCTTPIGALPKYILREMLAILTSWFS
jgi:uncharacterized SAM-binding protein YcdF (DUF218 family)